MVEVHVVYSSIVCRDEDVPIIKDLRIRQIWNGLEGNTQEVGAVDLEKLGWRNVEQGVLVLCKVSLGQRLPVYDGLYLFQGVVLFDVVDVHPSLFKGHKIVSFELCQI